MASSPTALDTTIEIVTPENIAFRYQVAGPFRRLQAYLIDFGIRVGIGFFMAFCCMLVFSQVRLPGLGMGINLAFWFCLAWFYGGMFETFWNGQTPGKRLMRIRVLSVNGQPINGLQAIMRNLLRAIDSQPGFFYSAGFFTTMMNDRFQRLGDLASGTMVVVEEGHWFGGVQRIDELEIRVLAREIRPDFQVSRGLARALGAYVQRRRFFPWTRRMEIAQHLGEPLRDRFDLPIATNLDHLLCAVYYRAFITDTDDVEPPTAGFPFREAPSPNPVEDTKANENGNGMQP